MSSFLLSEVYKDKIVARGILPCALFFIYVQKRIRESVFLHADFLIAYVEETKSFACGDRPF